MTESKILKQYGHQIECNVRKIFQNYGFYGISKLEVSVDSDNINVDLVYGDNPDNQMSLYESYSQSQVLYEDLHKIHSNKLNYDSEMNLIVDPKTKCKLEDDWNCRLFQKIVWFGDNRLVTANALIQSDYCGNIVAPVYPTFLIHDIDLGLLKKNGFDFVFQTYVNGSTCAFMVEIIAATEIELMQKVELLSLMPKKDTVRCIKEGDKIVSCNVIPEDYKYSEIIKSYNGFGRVAIIEKQDQSISILINGNTSDRYIDDSLLMSLGFTVKYDNHTMNFGYRKPYMYNITSINTYKTQQEVIDILSKYPFVDSPTKV